MTSKFKPTGKLLSSLAGLPIISKLMDSSYIKTVISDSIPRLKNGKSRHISKFTNLVLGFTAGAECLDDMALLNYDPVFQEIADRTYHPKSYGDFLRAFSGEDLWKLQTSLMKFANQHRIAVFPNENKLIFDCDSTLNRQYGKKMEGVEVNYSTSSTYPVQRLFFAKLCRREGWKILM